MGVRNRYRYWKQYRVNLQELQRCSDRDLMDLGIARSDPPSRPRGGEDVKRNRIRRNGVGSDQVSPGFFTRICTSSSARSKPE
ncbi:DUF1127 domain-containing protein [Phyllobacteriaceae bacterium JZ32]